LIGTGLFGLTLLAQAPGDNTAAAPAPQPQADKDKDKDKKPAPAAKKDDSRPQPDLGVAVDAGRKSDALATWITSEHNPGQQAGPWTIRQTVEFGGRFSDFTGNQGTWDTFVNLGTGPRLSEYTLDLHAPKHDGVLFDDLTFSNFGYGGDPNNLSRIRAQKGKIYSLSGGFRRDQNIFDYDLFANPLNPPTSALNFPIVNSPHEFLLTRRMSDVNLNLFPVGKIRFKLGWSRVVNEGASFSTDHQGTEGLILQPTLNTTDNYSFGVSFRFIPRTNINYDQFYTFYKGDTTGALAPPSVQGLFGIPTFTLSNGSQIALPPHEPCIFEAVEMPRERRPLDADRTRELELRPPVFGLHGAEDEPHRQGAPGLCERVVERARHRLRGVPELEADRRLGGAGHVLHGTNH